MRGTFSDIYSNRPRSIKIYKIPFKNLGNWRQPTKNNLRKDGVATIANAQRIKSISNGIEKIN